jgi:hypothetical protein
VFVGDNLSSPDSSRRYAPSWRLLCDDPVSKLTREFCLILEIKEGLADFV